MTVELPLEGNKIPIEQIAINGRGIRINRELCFAILHNNMPPLLWLMINTVKHVSSIKKSTLYDEGALGTNHSLLRSFTKCAHNATRIQSNHTKITDTTANYTKFTYTTASSNTVSLYKESALKILKLQKGRLGQFLYSCKCTELRNVTNMTNIFV